MIHQPLLPEAPYSWTRMMEKKRRTTTEESVVRPSVCRFALEVKVLRGAVIVSREEEAGEQIQWFFLSLSEHNSRTNPLGICPACGRQPSGKHLTHTAQSQPRNWGKGPGSCEFWVVSVWTEGREGAVSLCWGQSTLNWVDKTFSLNQQVSVSKNFKYYMLGSES